MEKYLIDTKNDIERQICAVHHKPPVVGLKIDGSGFTIDCCCDPFGEICTETMEKSLADNIEMAILNAFNKMR